MRTLDVDESPKKLRDKGIDQKNQGDKSNDAHFRKLSEPMWLTDQLVEHPVKIWK